MVRHLCIRFTTWFHHVSNGKIVKLVIKVTQLNGDSKSDSRKVKEIDFYVTFLFEPFCVSIFIASSTTSLFDLLTAANRQTIIVPHKSWMEMGWTGND